MAETKKVVQISSEELEEKILSYLNKSDSMVFQVMVKQHKGCKDCEVREGRLAHSTTRRIDINFYDDTWTSFSYIIPDLEASEAI